LGTTSETSTRSLKEYGTITILRVPDYDDLEIAETLASYLRARCDVS
jgi:hypothetical protein